MSSNIESKKSDLLFNGNVFREISDKGHVDITDIIPDTMTSWSISAFAINTNHGLGVVKNPVALTVLKPFFVTVNLPYSIVKTEQAVVEVFVHNYLNQAQHVTVRVQNAQKDFIHCKYGS